MAKGPKPAAAKNPRRITRTSWKPGQSGNPAGPESKYRPEYAAQAGKLAALGATDKEMAEFFGIADSGFRRWKNLYPDLNEACRIGKAEADDRVERSLYQRAVGYSFESEEVFCHQGQVTRVPVVKHIEPNVTAQIFWLKNRRREDWRDKVDHELTGKDGGAIAMTHGIDAPPRPETPEEWLARRQRELSAVVASTGPATARD